MNFSVNTGVTGQASTKVNVFFFDDAGSVWDNPLLFYACLFLVVLFFASILLRSPAGFGVFIILGLRVAWEFISMSLVLAVCVGGLVIVLGLAGILSYKKMDSYGQ